MKEVIDYKREKLDSLIYTGTKNLEIELKKSVFSVNIDLDNDSDHGKGAYMEMVITANKPSAKGFNNF